MPARYPNLLVNGTSGIAVGMATNIPPHNLREVVSAMVKIIDNIIEEDRTTDLEEILGIVKGPDFPTGAEILGTRGIDEACLLYTSASSMTEMLSATMEMRYKLKNKA